MKIALLSAMLVVSSIGCGVLPKTCDGKIASVFQLDGDGSLDFDQNWVPFVGTVTSSTCPLFPAGKSKHLYVENIRRQGDTIAFHHTTHDAQAVLDNDLNFTVKVDDTYLGCKVSTVTSGHIDVENSTIISTTEFHVDGAYCAADL